MPKRTHTRKKAMKRDRIAIPMNSGYTVILTRPPFNVARGVMAKAYELYPDPVPETEAVTTVTGATYQVAVAEDDEVKAQRQKAAEQAEAQRESYLLKFAIEDCMVVEDYEGEDGQQALIDELQPQWEQLLKWGQVPDDLAELPKWQQTVQLFIISDIEDYMALTINTLRALDADLIDPEEIAQKGTFL